MPDDDNGKRKHLLEELKITADDYRYRDQLMVTEFALSMTAVAIALNAVLRLETGWLRCLTLLGISLFLLIISNHMVRINQDRLSAGRRKSYLLEELNMSEPHGGFAGKRRGVAAPLSMVIFCWAVFAVITVSTLVAFCKMTVSTIVAFYNCITLG